MSPGFELAIPPAALAIYEWLGPDRYRIFIDRRGQTRPVEFVSEPGSGQILHVWQRQKRSVICPTDGSRGPSGPAIEIRKRVAARTVERFV